jgi:ribosomal protein S18 acetylase RimI-like enzyme
MDRPTIRLATIEDLPWIRALWRDMVAEGGGPPYPTNILASLDSFTRSLALALTQQPPQAFVFLAQLPASDTPDAYFAYEIQQRSLGEPSQLAFIHYIYTKPGARGHGLATTLLELGAEHMTAQGLAYVEATSTPDDTRFHDLGFTVYEYRGFAPVAGFPAAIAARRRRHGNGHADDFEVPPPIREEDADEDV